MAKSLGIQLKSYQNIKLNNGWALIEDSNENINQNLLCYKCGSL